MAFPRDIFNQYFIKNISINVASNSQITVYHVPSIINNGSTNRNNGRVIVDAKIQIRINLLLEI